MGPLTRDELFERDWFLIPADPAPRHYDEGVRRIRDQLVPRYDGLLCAVCQSRRCDDASSFVLKVHPSESDEHYEFTAYPICRSCAGDHPEPELIALGRAGRLVLARRGESRKASPPVPTSGSPLVCPLCGGTTTLFSFPDLPGPGESARVNVQPCPKCGEYIVIARGTDGRVEIYGS